MAIDGGFPQWVDRRALDRHGVVIGTVIDVYEDSQTGREKWLAITTGYFGTRRVVAPVQDASLLGDDVVVAHAKDVIVAAPVVHTFTALTPADERSVSAYFARNGAPPAGHPAERQHP